MERLKFIGKRLVYLVIMLIGVATLVFILTKMVPGDPVTANLSQRALGDPEIVAAYKAKYGLDQPIYVQYVKYIQNLLKLDLGTSIRTNKPVLDEYPGATRRPLNWLCLPLSLLQSWVFYSVSFLPSGGIVSSIRLFVQFR